MINQYNTRLALDIDGTTHDSLPFVLDVTNRALQENGFNHVSMETYKLHFDPRDWTCMYAHLGAGYEHADAVIASFYKLYKQVGNPPPIPGAINAVLEAKDALGHENVSFITHELREKVLTRFERDGLTRFLDTTVYVGNSKANALYQEAKKDSSRLIYVGYLTTDGISCQEAREMGADNLFFYGLTHEYAGHPENRMRLFISANPEFARELKHITQLHTVWKNSK